MSQQQRAARLISAAGRGDVLEVKKYIENDVALLRTQDDESGLFPGWTALHWAVRNGHLDVAKVLLDEADRMPPSSEDGDPLIHIRDHEGDTALHIAISWGQVEMVQLLYDRSPSSLKIKNKAEKVPLDLASPELRAVLALAEGYATPGQGMLSKVHSAADSRLSSRQPSRTNSQGDMNYNLLSKTNSRTALLPSKSNSRNQLMF